MICKRLGTKATNVTVHTQKSRTWIRRRQLPLSLVRSFERCRSCKSLLICSSHVLLGVPQLLIPSTMVLSILLTGASYVFLYTCPNHLSLFSRIFVKRGATPNFSLNSWFLILSTFVCSHIHLSIRISVTSILCPKTFFTGQHYVPYNKADLIATR